MGVDNNFYLGAYVELPKVTVKSSENINTCMNKSCVNHMLSLSKENVFCNKCGDKLMMHLKEGKETSRFFDFFAFEEANNLPSSLFYTIGESNKFRLLIPNVSIKNSLNISAQLDQVMQPINAEYINVAIKEFKELLGPRYEILKKLYNIDLEVKFGLVSYYS